MTRRFGGIAALSQFQKKKLLADCAQLQVDITDIQAEYIHFVDTQQKLTVAEDTKLQALLSYGTPFQGKTEEELLLVVPRPGTISPWSSKATDIAHNSGLGKVIQIERGIAYYIKSGSPIDHAKIADLVHDRMTETLLTSFEQAASLFAAHQPRSYQEIPVIKRGKAALEQANADLGLALSTDEIEYLGEAYQALKRDPTDVELMMFAQVNSEHCRHKIFNAEWVVDGVKQPKSLFQMIKNTYQKHGDGVLSAYKDNAAVLAGPTVDKFYPDTSSGDYKNHTESANLVIKAETHNHPTAIAPAPGAASGISGEIRDEAATGRGGKSKMGFSGYSVSNLHLPGYKQPWEQAYGKPDRISSALDIMIQAPIGGAAYANEFGRPSLGGYFRTYQQSVDGDEWGYHKPLMICGGLGNIDTKQVEKLRLQPDNLLIILGGPGMLVGLGGGGGSSMQAGQSSEELDFASVQRANAEMQRRAQEVINSCVARGTKNPIRAIHDIGAGGLSNGFPELVHDSGLGARFELRDIHNGETGMSPMAIWCNEVQERFVLGIEPEDLDQFRSICKRERCLFAVIGTATEEQQLVVDDRLFKNKPIDIPMDLLFGKPPRIVKEVTTKNEQKAQKFDTSTIKMEEAIKRVLHMPSVGSKKFLITIGDRTVGGMSVRDQMVGPWQVPVSDVAVTANSFEGNSGEAVAIGERSPLAVTNAPASGRMAIGEALTNIAAAPISKLSDVKLSANWMAASGYKNEDQHLFDIVRTVGEDFCPQLGLTIPVGKDSLHMRTTWKDGTKDKSVTSPVSLIISAFSPVADTSRVLTPELHNQDSSLLLIDLGLGRNRLGGSALAQAYNQTGTETPDIAPETLRQFFKLIQQLNAKGKILAYHDRSDGGLFASLVEMAFAGRQGLDIDISNLPGTTLDKLFNEELGAVIQVATADETSVLQKLTAALGGHIYVVATPTKQQDIIIKDGGEEVYQSTRTQLETWWAETSYQIQKLRDNPQSAEQEFAAVQDNSDPGISPKITFSFPVEGQTFQKGLRKPRVAVLREQGINGQVEMAAAFDTAGFTAVDVHMSDLTAGKHSLADFSVLAACGGFSYGDVLGAGEGWAKSILFNDKLRKEFQNFFGRPDTLSLGVCNGCQMLSALKELIPGTDHWPRFLHNESGRYEGRLVSVRVNDSPSVFFRGMTGSILPIPVAHGEGRAVFTTTNHKLKTINSKLAPLQYVDNHGTVTQTYPLNPNGSDHAITALTSTDGRATILMPHPERVFLTKQLSWHPADWPDASPWLKIFQNARQWFS